MGSHEFIRFPPYELIPTASVVTMLGEIHAKIECIQQMPIDPTERDRLRTLYLARAVHGSTAIEGNTLSEADVLHLLVEPTQSPQPKDYNEQEVRNVIAAINEVVQELSSGDASFSVEKLNRYHSIVMRNISSQNCDEHEIGAIRQRGVVVGRYGAAPAHECPHLLGKLCDWLNEPAYTPSGHVQRYNIAWRVVKAIIAHMYFEWIHPYCDGNGRLGRLIEFKILYSAGIPDIACHLFSNFYNKQRTEYVGLLQDSHGDFIDGAYPAEANIRRFVEFALEGFLGELDKQRLEVHNSQITVIWHEFIHSRFPKRLTNTQQRRKQLALDLTHPRFQNNSAQIHEIRELSPALAVAYSSKTDRTIRNDLNALVDMQLLQRDVSGFKPNIHILMGFFGASTPAAE
ncbi:MAG: Fic family protein [Chloroflexota bacterium]|nr:Fic family protein [Chloroflexota bacterium]